MMMMLMKVMTLMLIVILIKKMVMVMLIKMAPQDNVMVLLAMVIMAMMIALCLPLICLQHDKTTFLHGIPTSRLPCALTIATLSLKMLLHRLR